MGKQVTHPDYEDLYTIKEVHYMHHLSTSKYRVYHLISYDSYSAYIRNTDVEFMVPKTLPTAQALINFTTFTQEVYTWYRRLHKGGSA